MSGKDLEDLGVPLEWADRLRERVAGWPDETVQARLRDMISASVEGDPALRGPDAWREQGENLLRVLDTLATVAPFLVSFVQRHPQWVRAVAADDLQRERSGEQYEERLQAALREVSTEEVAAALRRFKYRELMRITVREACGDLVPLPRAGETLAELSHLADVILAYSLETAAKEIETRYGPPVWRDDDEARRELSFCVLALGKLGSEELNYSSDVDLVYVYESVPDGDEMRLADGPSALSPREYFSHLAHRFGALVTRSSGEGFLYRIDLDLRPQGQQGPLVVSDLMLAEYYEGWADTWEKAAFMKARPVAGERSFGWRVIRAIDPMIYRTAMDLKGVNAIRSMKAKVEEEKGRSAETFDVKVGAGGIRDVESIAQALQLLHGGRIPQVRARSTQGALRALADVDVLPAEQAGALLDAYRFLRRLENRLQMVAERQTQSLPSDTFRLRCLAVSMGFSGDDAAAELSHALDSHRERIREHYRRIFDEERAEQIQSLFSSRVRALVDEPSSARMVRELALHFAQEIEDSGDPERAVNNLARFIEGVGGRRFYYELLIDRPELVPRLTRMFATSQYLSTYLATHPRLIEPIFADPSTLVPSRGAMEEEVVHIRKELEERGDISEVEARLNAMRMFHNRALVNVGLLDLGEKIDRAHAEDALTHIAEVCLKEALALAEQEMQRRGRVRPVGSEFLVVGMGKLASRELTYGSDLDVIFVYDGTAGDPEHANEAQEYFVRLAQKLIWGLRTRTAEGVCYAIDARLRPSGRQGTLVTSLPVLRDYHRSSARVWERQALLRARAAAGPEPLAAELEALRRDILRMPLPEDVTAEVHRIRMRSEEELARESGGRVNFKTGRGGILDVENVVQCVQLRHGPEHEELWDVVPIAELLRRIERLHLLEAAEVRALGEGWAFLQRLSSRLRIVENRSISDLDQERGDLETLAHRLGYTSPQRSGGARRSLLEDYRMHTDAIREVYLRYMGVEK